METRGQRSRDGVYRLTTPVAEVDLGLHQCLVTGEQPLLFHTGMRMMFPPVREAVASVIPVETLRWISFGHFEADESGAMDDWLPHGWDAGGMYDENTHALFRGGLLTMFGAYEPTTIDDPAPAAIAIERADGYGSCSRVPNSGEMVRRMAGLGAETLAPMHWATYSGDVRCRRRGFVGPSVPCQGTGCPTKGAHPRDRGRGLRRCGTTAHAARRGVRRDPSRRCRCRRHRLIDETSPSAPPGRAPVVALRRDLPVRGSGTTRV